MMYEYRAKVVSVYDGDSIRVDINCGFGIWIRNERIRLASIDAPELRGENRVLGLASRDYLRELILGKEVTIKTYKDKKGKYGRYIGEIFLNYVDNDNNINDIMVKEGHAIYKEY